jgi:hypothetical protein
MPAASPRRERSMLAICRGGATGYGCGHESGRALSPSGVARLATKRSGTPCASVT